MSFKLSSYGKYRANLKIMWLVWPRVREKLDFTLSLVFRE